jgi:hypothetical protein
MSFERGNGPGLRGKAEYQDAELILRLYELRRDPTMREARDFINFKFWPADGDDAMNTLVPGSKEHAYFRQVSSYWDMAVSFVVRGALDSHLFFDNSGEMFFTYAKLKPAIPKVRENNPQFWRRVEEFILGSPESLERLRTVELNVDRMRQRMKGGAAAR